MLGMLPTAAQTRTTEAAKKPCQLGRRQGLQYGTEPLAKGGPRVKPYHSASGNYSGNPREIRSVRIKSPLARF